jgi:hypothetical protein
LVPSIMIISIIITDSFDSFEYFAICVSAILNTQRLSTIANTFEINSMEVGILFLNTLLFSYWNKVKIVVKRTQ